MSRKRKPRQRDRREFLKASVVSVAGAAAVEPLAAIAAATPREMRVDDFARADSLHAGDAWESLNPGYFQIAGRALRRKLHNLGDQRPGTKFPWHWETHQKAKMPVEYDPSLPLGILWRRDWRLAGNYSIRIEGQIRDLAPREKASTWQMHQPGYAFVGIAFGGRSLHESWEGGAASGRAAWIAAWRDSGKFGVYDHAQKTLVPVRKDAEVDTPPPKKNERFEIIVSVRGANSKTAEVVCSLTVGGDTSEVRLSGVDRAQVTDRFFGIATRGLLDWQIDRVSLEPGSNKALDTPQNALHVCYALGDTLRQMSEGWRCRFVALFRSDGKMAEVRVAREAAPAGGWAAVPVAGRGPIVTNDFRMTSAVIDALLPADPSETDLYYTV